MKSLINFLLLITLAIGCKKDSIITSADARLGTSVDEVHFDTVFVTQGSVTKSFTVINENDQKLTISSIELMGGAASRFSMNVNGISGTKITNLTLNANDSLYVFTKVSIDPSSSQLPFLVSDSIEIKFNGNTRKVQLQAYGRNARFINGGTITANTTWNNNLPYVILKPLTVDAAATLTIEKGTKVYCHANAPLIVNGTLKALGEYYDSTRIVFRGDRLDAEYKDLPGSWPGILFNTNSKNNELRFVSILNAYQAVIAQGGATLSPAKIIMDGCIIDNAYDIGVFAFNSSLRMTNTLITQCGNDGTPGFGGSNLIINGGGSYTINHCTFATYSNYYQSHKLPVVYITNAAGTSSANLSLAMDNSIIYGMGGVSEDELVAVKSGASIFSVTLRNVLYKVKNDPANLSITNSLKNEDPKFDTVNTSRRLFNFRLRDDSPCLDAGLPGGPATDLDGKPRPVGAKPDMGCYEKQ